MVGLAVGGVVAVCGVVRARVGGTRVGMGGVFGSVFGGVLCFCVCNKVET